MLIRTIRSPLEKQSLKTYPKFAALLLVRSEVSAQGSIDNHTRKGQINYFPGQEGKQVYNYSSESGRTRIALVKVVNQNSNCGDSYQELVMALD